MLEQEEFAGPESMVQASAFKTERDDWEWDNIRSITPSEYYTERRAQMTARCVDAEAKQRMAKHMFERRTAEGVTEDQKREVFNYWHREKNRQYVTLIYLFKRTVYKTFREQDDNVAFGQQEGAIEFFRQPKKTFPHLVYMLETLGVIRNGNLDVGARFTTLENEQLFYNHEPEAAKRNYRNYSKVDFNNLIRGYNHPYQGRNNKTTPDTLRSVLSLILKSFFNYEVVSIGNRKRVRGRKISSYIIQPYNRTKNQPHPPCILSILKQEWPDYL